MVSSFFGLYTGQRSLSAQQTVLNIVGNNIANANTEGYSRQRVDLVTSSAYPQPILGTGTLPGTFGTGVEIETITRTRDAFLDAQYRVESCTNGYYTEKQWALSNAEDILMEPSDSGITAKLDAFFESAQQLSLNPESLAVRTNFVQQAIDLTTVFNQQAERLQELRTDLVGIETDLTSVEQSRLGMYVVDINSKLDSLSSVNREIITLKGNGVEPNDLLDERDRILDQLSEMIPITIDETSTGSVNVSLGANALVTGGIVNNSFYVQNSGNINDPADVYLTGVVPPVNADINSGLLGGILEMGGNSATSLTIRGLIEDMDLLATTIAADLNALQSAGQYINSATSTLAPAAGLFDEIFQGGGLLLQLLILLLIQI